MKFRFIIARTFLLCVRVFLFVCAQRFSVCYLIAPLPNGVPYSSTFTWPLLKYTNLLYFNTTILYDDLVYKEFNFFKIISFILYRSLVEEEGKKGKKLFSYFFFYHKQKNGARKLDSKKNGFQIWSHFPGIIQFQTDNCISL